MERACIRSGNESKTHEHPIIDTIDRTCQKAFNQSIDIIMHGLTQ